MWINSVQEVSHACWIDGVEDHQPSCGTRRCERVEGKFRTQCGPTNTHEQYRVLVAYLQLVDLGVNRSNGRCDG